MQKFTCTCATKAACLSCLPCCQCHISPFISFPFFFLFLHLTNTHRHAHTVKHAHVQLEALSLCCWRYFRLADSEKNNTNLYVWNGLLCASLHVADVPVVKVCACTSSSVCVDNEGIFCEILQWDHIHRVWFVLADAFASMGTLTFQGQVIYGKMAAKEPACVCVLQGSKVWWRPIRIASPRSSCTGPPTSPQSFRKWPPLPQRKCTPKKPWWVREWERWRGRPFIWACYCACRCLHWHTRREAKDK